jgi:hypothetical protein
VKNRFQSLPFKCNLQRYKVDTLTERATRAERLSKALRQGCARYIQLTRSLEPPGFQASGFKGCKRNLYRYTEGGAR